MHKDARSVFIKQEFLSNVFSSSVWALGSPLLPVTLWSEKEKQTLRSHPSHVGKHFNNQLSLHSEKVKKKNHCIFNL